jgi:hypothetical protein
VIESASRPLAQEMLALADHARRMPAIADRRRCFRMGVEVRDEGRHEAKRNTQIGIHEEDDFAGCPEHPRAHGESLAAVLRIFDHPDQRIAASRLPCSFHRAIPARLDHNQNLPQTGKLPCVSAQSPDGRPDAVLLRVGRHHN